MNVGGKIKENTRKNLFIIIEWRIKSIKLVWRFMMNRTLIESNRRQVKATELKLVQHKWEPNLK